MDFQRSSYSEQINGEDRTEIEITQYIALASDASIDFGAHDPGLTKIEVSNGDTWADCPDENNVAIAEVQAPGNKFFIHPVALTFGKCRIVVTNAVPDGTLINLRYRG